jgi:microcystin-dependent protein
VGIDDDDDDEDVGIDDDDDDEDVGIDDDVIFPIYYNILDYNNLKYYNMLNIYIIVIILLIVLSYIYINKYKLKEKLSNNIKFIEYDYSLMDTQIEEDYEDDDLIGIIKIWPGPISTIPDGYLVCDGKTLDINKYSKLYAKIKYQYTYTLGTIVDKKTQFKIPNMINRKVIGQTNNLDKTKFNNVGSLGGLFSIILNSNNLKPHNHYLFSAGGGGDRAGMGDGIITDYSHMDLSAVSTLNMAMTTISGDTDITYKGKSYILASGETEADYGFTGSEGDNMPVNILNKSIFLNYIIFTGKYNKQIKQVLNGSIELNQIDSYILIPYSNNYMLDMTNFTVEWWQYRTDNNKKTWFFNNGCIGLGQYNTDTDKYLIVLIDGIEHKNYNISLPVNNTWNHIALCYTLYVGVGDTSRFTYYISINGITVSETDEKFSIFRTYGTDLIIGNNTSENGFAGYITNFRYLVGTALYTSPTYKVPIYSLTSLKKTALLLSPTKEYPFRDLTFKNKIGILNVEWSALYPNLTTNETEITSDMIDSKTIEHGSIAFSYNSELIIKNNDLTFNVYDMDFTLEFWFLKTNSSFYSVISNGIIELKIINEIFEVRFNDCYNKIDETRLTEKEYLLVDLKINTEKWYKKYKNIEWKASENIWNHVAMCYSNTEHILYISINGKIFNLPCNPIDAKSISNDFRITIEGYYDASIPILGYITDFRFTKGIVLYKKAFNINRNLCKPLVVLQGTTFLLSPTNINNYRDLASETVVFHNNTKWVNKSPYIDGITEGEQYRSTLISWKFSDERTNAIYWKEYLEKKRKAWYVYEGRFLNDDGRYLTDEELEKKIDFSDYSMKRFLIAYEEIKERERAAIPTTTMPTTTTTTTPIPTTTTTRPPDRNGSIEFSGDNSYIEIINSITDFDVAGVDYTIEWWQYRTDINNDVWFFNNDVIGFGLKYLKLKMLLDGSKMESRFPDLIVNNQWLHIAISVKYNEDDNDIYNTRSLYYIYVNGIEYATFSDYQTNKTPTSNLLIGNNNSYPGFAGYITNFRFTKGKALYTTKFTVPTQPLVPIEGTTLLLAPINNYPSMDLTNKNKINLINAKWSSMYPFNI